MEAAAPQSFQLGRIRPSPSPKSLFTFICSISATALGAPGPPQPASSSALGQAVQGAGKWRVVWAASEVLNKAHHWPPPEPPPASRRAAPPPLPAWGWVLPSLLPVRLFCPPKDS